jgi:undecaprenyl-diphosphatase
MSLSGGLNMDGSRAMLRQAKANLDGWIAILRRTPRPRSGPGLWPWPAGVVVVASAAIIVPVAVVTVTADAWAIGAARTLPEAVHSLFRVITEFGKSGWFLWPIGIVLIALGLAATPASGRIGTAVVAALAVRLTFVFAAIALPGLFTAIIKRLIGRARPFVGGAADPYLYDPFVWKAAYASLPSGHATTAFAAAVAIGAVWPQARLYVWIYALLIAVSRVVVIAHHPSDVLTGAVVGVIGAVMVRNWFAARRLAFAVAGDDRVRAMPGPSWRRLKRVAVRLFRP